MLAFNARTELVKFAFLFCLNLIEWIGATFAGISFILHFLGDSQKEFPTSRLLSVLGEWDSKLHVQYIDNTCITINMAILGCLCMYLSARYAQKSWIKSKGISYWICFFLLSSIAAQILITICYTFIIGIWCDTMLVTLSVVFAWKQYRKLNMVLQWSIVDLRVSGDTELLERHVRMKRRFNRIFTAMWIGVYFLLAASYISLISQKTLVTVFP